MTQVSNPRKAEIRRLITELQRHVEVSAGSAGGAVPDVLRYLTDELHRQVVREEDYAELYRDAEMARDEVREYQEQNRAKDRFLAVLSHELRTPLQPVLAACSALLRDGRLPTDCIDQIRTIQRNVQLEARLIDDLLDLTKITSGKLVLEKQPVNMHSVIARSVEICEPDAIDKKLTLSVALRATRQWVMADPGRLHQVLWNLIKNAVKFTPAGGSVTIETSDADDQRILVRVIDSGIGIDPQVLGRVFDAFEQGDPRITRQFGGLGLGLAISKLLVQQHEGTLEAQSEGAGRGSTFRLILGTHETPKTHGGTAHRAPVPTRTLRILLIEDDADTSHIMGKLLVSLKHEVTCVASCNAAFKAAEPDGFDLVICDLGLPDGSGLDVIGPLKVESPRLRSIALTGYGTAEDIARSHAAGFDEHLTKPITLEQLVQSIIRLFP